MTGASVDLVLGLFLLLLEHRRSGMPFGARQFTFVTAGAVVLIGIVATSQFDHTVLTSGVYRYGTVQAKGSRDVPFYKDGRTATVSVRRIPETGGLTLGTNGKPDASLGAEWLSAAADTIVGPLTYDASASTLHSDRRRWPICRAVPR